MDIHGLPSEKTNAGETLGQQKKATKIDVREDVIRNRHSVHSSDLLPTQSSGLSRLAAELNRLPEIRHDEVSRVKDRLNSGYYSTREAAEETARILDIS